MIHWAWLIIPVVLCLSFSFFYVNWNMSKIAGILDDITETLKNHNITIAKMADERIELIETILPPTKTGLH